MKTRFYSVLLAVTLFLALPVSLYAQIPVYSPNSGSGGGGGGSADVFPADTTGVVVNTSASDSRNASSADIVQLWNDNGSCVGFLNADGTCGSPSVTSLGFDKLTTGTSVVALSIGTGGSLVTTGTGSITATHMAYSGLTGTVPAWNQNTTGAAAKITGGSLGQIPYQSAASVTAFLPANTTDTDQVVVSHGSNSAGTAPLLSNAPALSAANLTNFPILNQSTSGNAATATALATTPSSCDPGNSPQGIDAQGNVLNCTPYQIVGSYATFIGLTSSNFFTRFSNTTGALSAAHIADNDTSIASTEPISAPNFIGSMDGVSFIFPNGNTQLTPGWVPVATGPNTATWGNNNPTGTGFAFYTDSVRDSTAHTIQSQDLPATITSDTTGKSDSTSAFDHTPTGCQPVSGITTYATGIDSQGNSTGCSSPTGSGQPGSVTTVIVDDIPDLANTTTVTASTTPHVSFTLLGAPAHSFFGNNTDTEDGAVGYSNLTISDLPEEVTGTQAHNTVFASPDAINGIPSFRSLLATDIPFAAPKVNPSFTGNVFTSGGNFSTPDGGYCFGASTASSTPVICLWSDDATHVHFGGATKGTATAINVGALNFQGNLQGNATGLSGGQAANTFYAGPIAGNATATFRTIVSADFPTNPAFNGNVSATGNITAPNGNMQSANGFVTPNGSVVTGGLFTDNRTLVMTDTSCGTSVSGVENVLMVDGSAITTSRVCSISLLSGTASKGLQFTIIKVDSNSLAQFNVTGTTGTINGQAGYTLYQQYQSVTVQSDGTNWHVIAQNNPNVVNDQPANLVLASPNGSFGHVGYRSIFAADIPFAATLTGNNTLTGINTVPTPASTVNNTQIANMAAVHAVVNNIKSGVVTMSTGSTIVTVPLTGLTISSVCTASVRSNSGSLLTTAVAADAALNSLQLGTAVASPATPWVISWICTLATQ